MIDKKELDKLFPEQRIRKLRLLEENKKKEVQEIEQLIRESFQQLKSEKLAEDIAPQQKAVDISRLFEKNNEQKLEKTAKEFARATALMWSSKGYQAIRQTYEAYYQLDQFNKIISIGGNLTREHIELIGQIGERINRVEKYMTEGEKAASKLDASRIVLYKLKKETGLG